MINIKDIYGFYYSDPQDYLDKKESDCKTCMLEVLKLDNIKYDIFMFNGNHCSDSTITLGQQDTPIDRDSLIDLISSFNSNAPFFVKKKIVKLFKPEDKNEIIDYIRQNQHKYAWEILDEVGLKFETNKLVYYEVYFDRKDIIHVNSGSKIQLTSDAENLFDMIERYANYKIDRRETWRFGRGDGDLVREGHSTDKVLFAPELTSIKDVRGNDILIGDKVLIPYERQFSEAKVERITSDSIYFTDKRHFKHSEWQFIKI